MSDSLQPHELYSPWNSLGQNTGVGSLSLLQENLPNPGIKHRSHAFQADSLPAKPQGKPSYYLGRWEKDYFSNVFHHCNLSAEIKRLFFS